MLFGSIIIAAPKQSPICGRNTALQRAVHLTAMGLARQGDDDADRIADWHRCRAGFDGAALPRYFFRAWKEAAILSKVGAVEANRSRGRVWKTILIMVLPLNRKKCECAPS